MYSSPQKVQGYVKNYLNEKAPKIESKYNLSSIGTSDQEEGSTGEASYENLIKFKDADLQKLNKNPLNQVEKKLKKVYKKIE